MGFWISHCHLGLSDGVLDITLSPRVKRWGSGYHTGLKIRNPWLHTWFGNYLVILPPPSRGVWVVKSKRRSPAAHKITFSTVTPWTIYRVTFSMVTPLTTHRVTFSMVTPWTTHKATFSMVTPWTTYKVLFYSGGRTIDHPEASFWLSYATRDLILENFILKSFRRGFQ